MPIHRITISVPKNVAARIKKAAGAKPVSTWVTDLIEEHLDEAQLLEAWRTFYAEVHPTAEQEREADGMFERLTRAPRRRGAA